VCVEKYKRNLETDEGLIENIKLELSNQSFKLSDLIHKFQSVNSKRLNDLINKLIDDDVLSIDEEKHIYLK
jgi:transcriptional regulator CtsR